MDPRANQVLAMRRAGVPYDAIMQELHIPTQATAERLFEEALTAHKVKYSTDLELDRLDRQHLAAWAKAADGDAGMMDRVQRIAEARRALQAKPTDNDHAVRKAFDQSVEASTLVDAEVDAGAIATGRMIADRIDEAVASGEGQEVTKALYLAPHLMNVLKALLATPEARLQRALLEAKGDDEDEDERELAELTVIAGGMSGKGRKK